VTILVLLVLVVLWVVVLTPMAVRRFRQGHSDGTGSIDSFHEQLHLLERAGPKRMPPAHRLETRTPATAAARRADLVLVGPAGAAALGPDYRPRPAAERAGGRRHVRRRRRDVLLGLVATAVLTGSLGAVHGLHMLWVLAVLSVMAIAGFVALAAYAQLLEADRQVYRPLADGEGAGPLHATRGPSNDASQLGPAVVALGARIPAAARAGYPGAWDEEPEDGPTPRHAAAGS
jgi:hypothetical protein